MAPLRFHVADYAVFGLTLAFSIIIGIYHAVGGKQSTTKAYLLANRKMMSVPVALSLLASFMSGITILGVPSEIYRFGIQYWLVVLSYTILFPSVALVFAPILYELELTSSYEYLEKRFSVGIRMIGTLLFILYTLLYMAIATYGPALALESVTGLPIWVTILSLGIVCTFYTSIGGMTAVIWNDVFQAIVMLGGLIAVAIVGTYKVGGPSRVVTLLRENNRTNISFSVDPTERTTFWVMLIGGAFGILPLWSVNQTAVQRFLSAKSLKDAQRSVWYSMPMSFLAVSLCSICGAVIYAYYQGCDPILLKHITSPDQVLPYFVLDVIGYLHGLPGVFLACLFSGTLSTLSSGLNSLTAVFLEDFIKPLLKRLDFNVSEQKLTLLSKIVAALFGILAIGLSFLAGSLGTILQSFYQISGVTGGPVVAVFSIGMFTRIANKKGAYVGMICGISFGLFVAVGARMHKPPFYAPRASTERCQNNVTISFANVTAREYDGLSIYKMSPFWYSFYCYFITFFVGLLVSFLFKEDDHVVDERLLFTWKRIFPSKFVGTTSISNDEIALDVDASTSARDLDEVNEVKKDSLVCANSIPLIEMKTNF